MSISIIVAIGNQGQIGVNNRLPWKLKEDLENFRKLTIGNVVIFGRKTFESIGRPLPNRTNVVATLDKNFKADGVIVTNNLFEYLESYKNKDEELFVIGGKQIYVLSLPYADRLYITHINKAYEGNIYFPKINYNDYNVIYKKDVGELSFVIYERKK